jgi:hypothetical protein
MIMIANRCDNRSQLALAMTCQQLHNPAVNALYRSVFLKSTICRDLFIRPMGYGLTPRRLQIAKIQSLKMILPLFFEPRDLDIIGLMKDLRHLDLAFTNSQGENDRMTLPQKLPPTLISCMSEIWS